MRKSCESSSVRQGVRSLYQTAVGVLTTVPKALLVLK